MEKISHNPDANLKKYVAFDLDSTLIKPKSGRKRPIDENDWIWFHECVPSKLKQLNFEGYHVLIITNQTANKLEVIINKIKQILEFLDFTITVFICYGDKYRKPCKRVLIENVTNTSFIKFYCGDAVGRPGDFSNSDLLFAFNSNIPITTPEEYFLEQSCIYNLPRSHTMEYSDPPSIESSENNIILMCGYPASGKSTFVNSLGNKYLVISQDVNKTKQKTRKLFIENVGKCPIVIDNTSPTMQSRKYFVDIAKQKNISIFCVHCITSINVAFHMNYYRTETDELANFIPPVVYYKYRKTFEEPQLCEGFVNIYRFAPNINEGIFKDYRFPLLE